MSDNIPLEIQAEIIKRLPVKSVVQCRSVSKIWKSLIDSSEFIKSYHSCKTHLFVKYKLANELKYVSIVDDDTFPNHKSSLTVPQPVSQLGYISTYNSVNGLLCLYGSRQDALDRNEKIAVLWNPSVEKAVGIPISNSLRPPTGFTFIGFGVCPNTSDPKLVRINTVGYPTVLNWEVEVFTLTTRVWKSVSNIPPAFKTCGLTSRHVCTDGFIYWLAYGSSIKLAHGMESNLIISFDLKSHGFGEVCLPDRLLHNYGLVVAKVYESLGLFEYYNEGETGFCDVWIIKEGVTKSFIKMLSIMASDSWVSSRLLELRKNGEAIIENIDDTNSSVLEVYDPSSGSISGMGINGAPYSFSMNPYMENLLLLDESNSIIH